MAFSVFISYSTRDLLTADLVRQWVGHAGAQAFLAEYSVAPGQVLANDILNAIRQCDLFVLLWSAAAQGSDWVPQEIGVARGLDKAIIPVVLQANVALPAFIGGLKYLPLYRDPKAAVEWLHSQVGERVRAKELQGAIGVAVLTVLVAAVLLSKSK